MKIYICITPFFPSENSFRGPFIFDQVKAIERNSDFRVLVFKPSSFLHAAEDYIFDEIKVYRSKDFTLPSNILPNQLSDKLSYKAFRKKLKEININPKDIAVIHAHTTDLASYAILLKRDFPHIKSIIQHHGFDIMGETNGRLAKYEWHKKLCRRYGTKLCNKADLNVGVSEKTLSYVKEVEGVNLKNEYILYNGVDTSKFYPIPSQISCPDSQFSPTVNRTKRIFTIGCVGNFWELKDQMTLIKAVELLIREEEKRDKENPPIHTISHSQNPLPNNFFPSLQPPTIFVRFVGTGYTRENCENYIKQHNLTHYFEFIDEIKHADLPDFYRGLDLFVLPSYWEAFGCVYTEAYACGVPFIGVKGQGISEIIDDEDKNNWLIDTGDYKKLAKLIFKTFANSSMPKLISSIEIDALIKQYMDTLLKI